MSPLMPRPQRSRDAAGVLLLECLRQTKIKGLIFLEKWVQKTADADIKAGLESQLADERRHLRTLSDEIARYGGLTREVDARALRWVFMALSELEDDVLRLSGFYHGVRRVTLNRCGRLLATIEPQQARLIDGILCEDEVHIRWADLRIARLMSLTQMRQCNELMTRCESQLRGFWQAPELLLRAS